MTEKEKAIEYFNRYGLSSGLDPADWVCSFTSSKKSLRFLNPKTKEEVLIHLSQNNDKNIVPVKLNDEDFSRFYEAYIKSTEKDELFKAITADFGTKHMMSEIKQFFLSNKKRDFSFISDVIVKEESDDRVKISLVVKEDQPVVIEPSQFILDRNLCYLNKTVNAALTARKFKIKCKNKILKEVREKLKDESADSSGSKSIMRFQISEDLGNDEILKSLATAAQRKYIKIFSSLRPKHLNSVTFEEYSKNKLLFYIPIQNSFLNFSYNYKSKTFNFNEIQKDWKSIQEVVALAKWCRNVISSINDNLIDNSTFVSLLSFKNGIAEFGPQGNGRRIKLKANSSYKKTCKSYVKTVNASALKRCRKAFEKAKEVYPQITSILSCAIIEVISANKEITPDVLLKRLRGLTDHTPDVYITQTQYDNQFSLIPSNDINQVVSELRKNGILCSAHRSNKKLVFSVLFLSDIGNSCAVYLRSTEAKDKTERAIIKKQLSKDPQNLSEKNLQKALKAIEDNIAYYCIEKATVARFLSRCPQEVHNYFEFKTFIETDKKTRRFFNELKELCVV